VDQIAEGLVEGARERALARCRRDLWHLTAEVLGYRWNPEAGKYGKGLTEALHRPICEWYDYHREDSFVGLWMQRFLHKTTLAVGQITQDYLIDPSICLLYFHAVDDEASKVNKEVRQHILQNDVLRALDPVIARYPEGHVNAGKPGRIFPQKRKGGTRWYTEDAFTIVNRPVYRRFQTLLAKGAGSEVTGAHGDKAYLDDVIARKDVENGTVSKKQDWYENTVLPVVDDMIIRASGTPWGDWGMYIDWQQDPDWYTMVIPGATEEGWVEYQGKHFPDLRRALEKKYGPNWLDERHISLEPDYSLQFCMGAPPDDLERQRSRLKVLKRQMKANFGPQILCDPSPPESRIWSASTHEHTLPAEEFKTRRNHRLVVLTDPAPAGSGSLSGDGEKQRKDGTKDAWAICVVAGCIHGDREELVLVDGISSKVWEDAPGYDVVAHYCRHWRTPYVAGERVPSLPAEHVPKQIRKAARRVGARVSTIDLEWTYHGKKNYFTTLATKAKEAEFLILPPTPGLQRNVAAYQAFLKTMLDQARRMRFTDSGRPAIPHDDEYNVVAFGTDPAIERLFPRLQIQQLGSHPLDDDPEDDEVSYRSRYCLT
jgi:hypothetical protein